jgi:glucan phosphorylase
MSLDPKSALAYLVTRPARPRYQYRTMDDVYIAKDADCLCLDAENRQVTSDRLGGLAGRLAACNMGSVQMLSGPIAVVSLVVFAIGVTTLMH